MNPQELLAQRQRDYKKAAERQATAHKKYGAAVKRVQQLERDLLDAEDEDCRELGEALVDGRRPSAPKAERVRAALEKARDDSQALAFAAERAGQALDQLPQERRSEWLRSAQASFQVARADYERQLGMFAEARERLTEEAALVSFLTGGQTVWMGNTVRVYAAGVEGLAQDVRVTDMFDAFRDELAELEIAALTRGREVTGATPSS